jgi:hypothetical protein
VDIHLRKGHRIFFNKTMWEHAGAQLPKLDNQICMQATGRVMWCRVSISLCLPQEVVPRIRLGWAYNSSVFTCEKRKHEQSELNSCFLPKFHPIQQKNLSEAKLSITSVSSCQQGKHSKHRVVYMPANVLLVWEVVLLIFVRWIKVWWRRAVGQKK